MKSKKDSRSSVSFFEEEKPIGWLLAMAAAKFEKEFLKKITREKLFSSITASDHRLLKYLTADVVSSNDIARRVGVSKQAISKSISSLERRGFVVRKKSTEDGRSQLLLLTEKGKRLISYAIEVAKDLDRATLKQLGAKELGLLKDQLNRTIQPWSFDACPPNRS